jgi:dolichyl-phosphate-mannose--protein O-mannosyl transferase
MPSDRLLGWALPLLVTLFGGILRFWHLTRPAGKTLHSAHGLVFDEVYYAHDSFSVLHYGAEVTNQHLPGGQPVCHPASLSVCAEFIAHPPLGKWMIAVGEWLFDHGHSIMIKGAAYPTSTLSFRFSSAVIGTLSILLIARIARRLFRSTLLGCVAGLLLSLDGLEFVQSRLSLLDIFLMFWVLAAFGALLIDRDHTRKRLAARLDRPLRDGEWGRWLGWRPWRWVAGVCAGASVAVKWSGAYYIAAWLILAVLWDLQARRSCYEGARDHAGRGSAYWTALVKDATFSVAPLVVLPVVVYMLAWLGWFMAGPAYAYDYNFAVTPHASGITYAWEVVRGWWHYQDQIWQFSKGLDSGHPYRSRPWGWLLLSRPIAYFYNGTFPSSQAACGAATCSQEVIALGNPAIWWASIGGLVVTLWRWLGRRDWRGLAVLLPFLAGYLPWCYFDLRAVPGSTLHRTMFFYYMVPEVPFMVLAVTFAVALVLGVRRRGALADRPVLSAKAWPLGRTARVAAAGTYLALVVAVFAYFYPILAAEPIPYGSYSDRLWFDQCSNKVQTQENGPCWF